MARSDRYLRLLLILLISATFFEGYDSSILALLLPNIQATFHVSEAVLGLTRIPIELGLFVAFLVGIVPLIILTFLRRRMHETERFVEQRAKRERGEALPRMPFLAAWAPPYRRNLVLVGMVYLMRSIPFFAATAWWAYYAERERGFTTTEVAVYILVAYGIGCVGYYVCGRLMERIGRRPTAIIYFVGAVVFAVILFQTTDRVVAFFSLMLAVGFGLGVQPVLSAFGTELFPTEIRGQSAAWVRNWFEIAGYVFGPALVGILGDHATGAIGNVGDAVSLLMIMTAPGIYLIWRHMPETKGRELDELSPEEALLSEAALT